MEERERLILEFERIADEISELRGIKKMRLSEASEDVQEWTNRIADFILADRKRIEIELGKVYIKGRNDERFHLPTKAEIGNTITQSVGVTDLDKVTDAVYHLIYGK